MNGNRTMVAIRRPATRQKSSLFTLRNVFVVIMVIPLLNVALHIFQMPDESTNSSHNLLSDTWKADSSSGLRKPPPDIQINKVAEPGKMKDHDPHTDADDRIEKPPPAGKQLKHVDIRRVEVEPNSKPKVATGEKGGQPAREDGSKAERKEDPGKAEKSPDAKPEVKTVELDPGVSDVLAKHGTGPTKLGYVVDLVNERANPSFREASTPSHYEEVEKKVAGLVGHASLKSCEYIKDGRLHTQTKCRDPETPLYAYNGASFPRSLCGYSIEPGGAISMEEHCKEPAHLFPLDSPPLSGHGMPPITVTSNPGTSTSARDEGARETIPCDIPCVFEKNLGVDRFVEGTEWQIKFSARIPTTDKDAQVERTDFRRDVYYSTTSLSSSVPLSFYSFDKHNLHDRPPLDWEKAANKATYVLDENCNSNVVRRTKWFAAVQAAFPTAAYGSCHHNADLVEGETVETQEGRVALSKKNRIHLAFDEGTDKDFTTPIVWEALLSGAVPAILGARNSEDYLPPNSAIYAGRFNSWDKFAQHVKNVSENRTLWESYHRWRTDGKALNDFDKKFNFTRTGHQCRTCRWAYAKKYGLGWDHEQQVLRENHVSRTLCQDTSNSLVTKPFRERWVGGGWEASAGESESCTPTLGEAKLEHGGAKVVRTVTQHDGVVDISFSSLSTESDAEDITLQLDVDIRNTEGAYFPHSHTLVPTIRGPLVSSASIQDDKSKMTVLANWITDIRSPKQGVIEVLVRKGGETMESDGLLRRIRIISEDVSSLHDKMTEFFPSSYGKMMTKDFVDPVEFLYASE